MNSSPNQESCSEAPSIIEPESVLVFLECSAPEWGIQNGGSGKIQERDRRVRTAPRIWLGVTNQGYPSHSAAVRLCLIRREERMKVRRPVLDLNLSPTSCEWLGSSLFVSGINKVWGL